MNTNQNSANSFRERLNVHISERDRLERQLRSQQAEQEILTDKIAVHKEARALILHAVAITQQNTAIQISKLVTMAMRAVFDDALEFKMEFVTRRNSTECDLYFTDGEFDYDPLDSCGYGVADVASFALRVAYWSLGDTRPTLVFDEPFRQLSVDLRDRAADMVLQISDEIAIQMVIVTHSKELAAVADRVFFVTQKNKKSQVREVKPSEIKSLKRYN